MNTPFEDWTMLFPYTITTDIIETIGLDSMYADFQEVERISIEEAIRAGYRYEPDEDDDEEDDDRMSYEDFCEAVEDIAAQNDSEEALNALVALGRDAAQRALNAQHVYDRAYNDAQDEWINDWIDERIDPDNDEDDDKRDDLWNDAQETDAYEAFCDDTHEALVADLAAQFGIAPEALEHAIALMNDDHGPDLLDARLNATH
ncbi:hypothetical protein LGM54_30405 [Burkholderia cenocepacia]|uniref:hypothetical protein n=1 Tax=Burkholderia cenocepacia TaxID=95486 RepID=UPI001CF397F2|nr:hypothetical protein [Burkholderia cenocepacia]MCA7967297.1 hypothetical protein [Burkholderia cenocepacia]